MMTTLQSTVGSSTSSSTSSGNSSPLHDKVVLITGANRGIGEALVDAAVAAGARKVYAAVRRLETAALLVERHNGEAGRHAAVQTRPGSWGGCAMGRP